MLGVDCNNKIQLPYPAKVIHRKDIALGEPRQEANLMFSQKRRHTMLVALSIFRIMLPVEWSSVIQKVNSITPRRI